MARCGPRLPWGDAEAGGSEAVSITSDRFPLFSPFARRIGLLSYRVYEPLRGLGESLEKLTNMAWQEAFRRPKALHRFRGLEDGRYAFIPPFVL